MTVAGHENTSLTPCARSHWPNGVALPKSRRSKKPHTVGGNTMGMVKRVSTMPFQRLLTPMDFQAARRPSTKTTASAVKEVLSETHSGR